MRPNGISRSSMTINSIWKVRGRRPTLRRTCKVYIPRNLGHLDTIRLPATYEEDNSLVQTLKTFTKHKIHHFILVFAISFYLYAGALVFQHLETHCDDKVLNITHHRRELLQEIYNKSFHWNDKEAWMVNLDTIISTHELKVLDLDSRGNSSVLQKSEGWSMETSIFYCFTVITTIGMYFYSHFL